MDILNVSLLIHAFHYMQHHIQLGVKYVCMLSYFKGTADAVAEYCTAVSCPNAPNTF